MKSAVKKEKGKVDLFGERYRARAHQLSPRLRAVVSYINDNREVVLEHTAMEIATATQTSDATVVRAIQALGFAGLRELKQTMERWFGTSVTSAEKMRSTVTALSSDVNSSIDFVLEGHQRVCEVLSRPTTARRWLRRWHCSATRARWGSSVSAPRGSSPNTPPGCSAVLACRRT